MKGWFRKTTHTQKVFKCNKVNNLSCTDGSNVKGLPSNNKVNKY